MSDVTQILFAVEQGDPIAAAELLPLVYNELRRLAAQKMSQEAPGQTLQPTDLVHEAYLRLVGSESEPGWDSRGHFFSAAAEAMRRILIENARRRRSQKRGGGLQRHELVDELIVAPVPDPDLLELDVAVEKLAKKDARKAELVKLRYFAGLSIAEAAAILRISTTTADRDWAYARAWLHQEILSVQPDGSGAADESGT